MKSGRIMKALSGFYYVLTDTGMYQCRGRGVFRNQNKSPLVGDFVQFEASGNNEGYIYEIEERKNELIRPAVANVDQAIIVTSAVEPKFSSYLLDQFLVLIESKGITPIIFITKIDLCSSEIMDELKPYKVAYEKIGYKVEFSSTNDSVDHIRPYLAKKISVIAGQSGVGKTSLLNALDEELQLKTGIISQSLGRGKHTTRHVELIEVAGGHVADTPGFSTLDLSELERTELSDCFPEMERVQNQCKYRGCLHNQEPKCAVKTAVASGEIESFRYEHYLRFATEIEKRKPRY